MPDAGAGTSASTLSVEISTIVSSSATASPACFAHSRIVALGDRLAHRRHDDVDVLPALGSAASARRRGRRGAVRGSDLGEHGADVDRVALGGVDLDDGAVDRRGHLGVDLVGRDLDQDLIG